MYNYVGALEMLYFYSYSYYYLTVIMQADVSLSQSLRTMTILPVIYRQVLYLGTFPYSN